MVKRPRAASGGSAALPARFARNATSNYALTGVLMAVALITTPVLTSHLGPVRFGIWIFVGSTIAWVQLLDLGFGGAVVAAVARLSAAGEDDTLQRTLNTSFFLLVFLGLVALAVSALGALLLPPAIHLRDPLAGTTRALLLLLGLDMAISIPMDTFGCGMVALQRYDLLNATLIGVAVCQAIAWTVVLANGGGLLALGIATVAISLCGQAVRYGLFRRLLPRFSLSLGLVDRGLVRTLATPAGWYALGDSLEGFRDYASVLVLGLVRNVATAGIFAVGEKLATLGTKLGTPLVDPFFPHAAAMVGRGDDERLGASARAGMRLTAGVTIPFCLVVAVLARPALIAWVGPTYQRATPAVVILAVAFGLRSLGAVPSRIVSGSGGQMLIAVTSSAEVATQVVLTAVLGWYLGITGVALAVMGSVVCVELAVTLPLVTRRLRTGMVPLLTPVLRAHVLPLAVAGAFGVSLSAGPVTSVVRAHGRLAGVAAVAVAGAATLVVYAAVFGATSLDGDARRGVVAWLRRTTPPAGPGEPEPATSPGRRVGPELTDPGR